VLDQIQRRAKVLQGIVLLRSRMKPPSSQVCFLMHHSVPVTPSTTDESGRYIHSFNCTVTVHITDPISSRQIRRSSVCSKGGGRVRIRRPGLCGEGRGGDLFVFPRRQSERQGCLDVILVPFPGCLDPCDWIIPSHARGPSPSPTPGAGSKYERKTIPTCRDVSGEMELYMAQQIAPQCPD
jgi:hypothetical protein